MPVGVAVGLVGSLIGVGGGFFVVPFLLDLWRPGTFTHPTATAASLGVILLSALSGTWANAQRKRIDVRTGLLLAAGTLPGAWFGRWVIGRITDRTFRWSFAALLLGIALYLLLVRLKPGKGMLRGAPREVVDSDGQLHRYEVNVAGGVAVSLAVGVISSLFGIGGGLVLVPFLVLGYGAPTVVATATAQFAFVFTSAVGIAVAVAQGDVGPAGWRVMGLLGAGVVVGAQAGVAIAKQVRERLVKLMLAAIIVTVAALMVLKPS